MALGIQYAMRMRHFVTCGLFSLRYFSTLPHNLRLSKKKELLNIKYVLIFSPNFV